MDDATTAALINAGISYYQQKQNSKTPNTYDIPLSPSEQWNLKRRQELDQYDPTRDYASTWTNQLLQGLPQRMPTPNWGSSIMQGQSVGGGLRLPHFDFSQMPQYWKPNPANGNAPTVSATGQPYLGSGPAPSTPAKQGTGGGFRPNPAPYRQRTDGPIGQSGYEGGGGSPQWGEDLYSFVTRTNADPSTYQKYFPNGEKPPAASQPPSQQNSGQTQDGNPFQYISDHYQDLEKKFADFKEAHPIWWKVGASVFAAFAGIPGTVAVAWLNHMASQGSQAQAGSSGGGSNSTTIPFKGPRSQEP